jgi:XTP/dITP diphosphohydrolase
VTPAEREPGTRSAASPDVVPVEVPAAGPATAALPGSGDPLRRLVAVMDLLRSPGGCPWDAEQTHASLVPYVLEEAHEVAEAIERDDRANLREELGDLLLQVVFHARIAQEDPDDPFDVDDVADDLVAKLVRRHPHVFGGAPVGDPGGEPAESGEPGPPVSDADGVHRQWERIKKVEKQRESVLDGVPLALGALARAQKIASRAARAGLVGVPAGGAAGSSALAAEPDPGRALGERLLALVHEARAAGLDAEGELRRAARAWEDDLRAAERATPPPPRSTTRPTCRTHPARATELPRVQANRPVCPSNRGISARDRPRARRREAGRSARGRARAGSRV